jgi:hypothetical protein
VSAAYWVHARLRGSLGSCVRACQVKVRDATAETPAVCFPCKAWLDAATGDRKTVRTLTPGDVRADVSYTVVVTTSDVRGAGTTADVTLELLGASGASTGALRLAGGRDALRRGAVDTFRLRAPAVGPLRALRVAHDNRGASPAWCLETVVVTQGSSSPEVFAYHGWLEKVGHAVSRCERSGPPPLMKSDAVGDEAARAGLCLPES